MPRKKDKASPFVMITKNLLKDPEWKRLSSSAKVAYIYMRNKFNSKYCLRIVLTYKEMESLMCRQTFANVVRELIKAGFIEKIEQGGLMGNANVYEFKGEHRYFYYKGRKIG